MPSISMTSSTAIAAAIIIIVEDACYSIPDASILNSAFITDFANYLEMQRVVQQRLAASAAKKSEGP